MRKNYKLETLINQAQLRTLEIEEICYDRQLRDVEINTLTRLFSTRVLIDNKAQSLTNSLHDYDFLGGIFITDGLGVIDGWYRLQLWQAMGHDTIPCYVVHCKQEEAARLHLSLNQQAAGFDPSKFGLSFEHIELEEYGFSEGEIYDLRAEMKRVEGELKDTVELKSKRISRPTILVDQELMARIDQCKKDLKLTSRTQVLNHLITIYYESNQGI